MHLYQRLRAFAVAALVCGTIFAGRPASAQTQIQAGQVLISELRLRGPAGPTDEFVELYNNTDKDIIVQATDTSAGWSVVLSNGQIQGILFTVPNGTRIPARGHFLGANSQGYSLGGYPSGNPSQIIVGAAPSVVVQTPFATATPDATWDIDAPDGAGVAIFSTTSGPNMGAATRLDAFGYASSPALFREGAGFPAVVTANTEHTYYRDLRSTLPQDTNNNAADFLLVGTAISIQITRLGTPGPDGMYNTARDGKVNVAFCDGHAESVLQSDARKVRVTPFAPK
jgi:prepilin-type processing-associated H-X9-DG protein